MAQLGSADTLVEACCHRLVRLRGRLMANGYATRMTAHMTNPVMTTWLLQDLPRRWLRLTSHSPQPTEWPGCGSLDWSNSITCRDSVPENRHQAQPPQGLVHRDGVIEVEHVAEGGRAQEGDGVAADGEEDEGKNEFAGLAEALGKGRLQE